MNPYHPASVMTDTWATLFHLVPSLPSLVLTDYYRANPKHISPIKISVCIPERLGFYLLLNFSEWEGRSPLTNYVVV